MGNETGLEQTVIELLQAHSQSGVNQTNMLLMLSLVNIMGIVDILKRSAVDEGANIELQRGELSKVPKGMESNADLMNLVQQAATGQMDPVQLLGLLNQPGGQMPNPAALMGMLSQMMPPPQPSQQERKQSPQKPPQQPPPTPQYHQQSRENTQPSIIADKEYKPDLKQDNKEHDNQEQQKSYLKWDPRLG